MKYCVLILVFLLQLDLRAQCGTTPITYSVATTPASCSGCCDGTAQIVNLSGGCLPYTISWASAMGPMPSSSMSLSNLCVGNYTAVINDGGCCPPNSQVFYLGSSTGLNEISLQTNLKVYPIPFHDKLTIDCDLGNEIKTVRLSLIKIGSEKIVFEHTIPGTGATEIRFPHLACGVYFLQLDCEALASRYIKIIKTE